MNICNTHLNDIYVCVLMLQHLVRKCVCYGVIAWTECLDHHTFHFISYLFHCYATTAPLYLYLIHVSSFFCSLQSSMLVDTLFIMLLILIII